MKSQAERLGRRPLPKQDFLQSCRHRASEALKILWVPKKGIPRITQPGPGEAAQECHLPPLPRQLQATTRGSTEATTLKRPANAKFKYTTHTHTLHTIELSRIANRVFLLLVNYWNSRPEFEIESLHALHAVAPRAPLFRRFGRESLKMTTTTSVTWSCGVKQGPVTPAITVTRIYPTLTYTGIPGQSPPRYDYTPSPVGRLHPSTYNFAIDSSHVLDLKGTPWHGADQLRKV
ncbi:unnamed protein product [Trichogramma brassicae]|uniref:Uncharacterized protein n=1 Tax=Trichogramma brassicae TaxID=86971 RepID=A0A6H5HY29_9HYME|nr:unnamed protein product [Trichogramma brassicae]